MTARKPKRVPQNWRKPLYVYAVQGIDGALISRPYWYREHALADCPRDCGVLKFVATLSPPPKRRSRK